MHGVKGAGIHCAGQKRESRDNHDGGNQALPLIHDGFRRLFDDGQSHVRGVVQLLPLQPSVTFARSDANGNGVNAGGGWRLRAPTCTLSIPCLMLLETFVLMSSVAICVICSVAFSNLALDASSVL